MSGPSNLGGAGETEAAADWAVRLHAPEAGESDWLAFEAWLAVAPDRRRAYDAAAALWAEIDARSEDLAAALGDEPFARAPVSRWRLAAFGVAGFVVVALLSPYIVGRFQTPAVAYVTAKGERRTVMLADGSRVDINSGSLIRVRMDGGRREVAMEDAEAAFDVAHDPSRPFIIHVGDQTVRVVGTQFDVSHRDGTVLVTVRRGVVRVSPKSGDAVALTPGYRLTHLEGSASSTVEPAPADDAFAWVGGRMICRNQLLSSVVAELNRSFKQPVRLEGAGLADLRFSGVLTIDDETATVQRLSALLPLSATTVEGVIVLKSRD